MDYDFVLPFGSKHNGRTILRERRGWHRVWRVVEPTVSRVLFLGWLVACAAFWGALMVIGAAGALYVFGLLT